MDAVNGRYWTVPRMWEGRTCAIMASGHGMNAQVAADLRAAKVPSIVINNTFQLAPWADVLYAADARWWHVHHGSALAFGGRKASICDDKGRNAPPYPGVSVLRNTGPIGFDPDPSCLRTGGNSGYQALHLAVHTGATTILLCGYNMGGPHWHAEHQLPLRRNKEAHYMAWRSAFAKLSGILSALGVEVLNCTPNSTLECFPRRTLADALMVAA